MAGLLAYVDRRARFDRVARDAGRLYAVHVAGCLRAFVADTPVARAIGMLATPDLGVDEALVLVPCSAVHGIGLRCAIGVAFVDETGVVMRVVDPLPWWGARMPGAHAVIEACTGVLAGLRPGDTIAVEDDHVFPLRGNSASQ
jgi:uncharacterized membrane protein (UPF0127 family)